MQALIVALMLPLTLLNIFGGIVSGIWLAVLGQWWAIGIGLAAIFAHIFISPVMLLGLAFGAPAAALINRGQYVLALPFVLLSQLFTYGVIAAWCVAAFHIFMSRAGHQSYLPLLIWSYGVAVGPWGALSERERRSGGGEAGLMATFFVQIAYVVTALVAVFGTSSPITWLTIFLGIMLVGMLAQTAFAAAIMFSQKSFR